MKQNYRHTPGKRGKGAVLDVGLQCSHSCTFCYYKNYNGSRDFEALRQGGFRCAMDLIEILKLFKHHSYNHFDVTGGEPTLHPDIVPIIEKGCRELGLAGRIITLGQFLHREYKGNSKKRPLIDALLDAGLTDFLFSLHAADETQFHQFTRGSLKKLEKAMDHLDGKDFQYGTNTVVFKGNLTSLQAISEKITKHHVYIHNFILFNAYHGWRDASKTPSIQAKYSDIRPHLESALEKLNSQGKKIAVNIRYAPYCVLKGMEKHIVGLTGTFYDPFEWQNRACNYDKSPEYCAMPVEMEDKYSITWITPEKTGDRYKVIQNRYQDIYPYQNKYKEPIIAIRGDHFTVFPEKCKDCAALPFCDGLSPIYLRHHGSSELSPYDHFGAEGALPGARLNYTLPFHVKKNQFEKII
ncbi:Radical SAM domain protein [Desulfamplus magnetovallimortis]|uniref:Radical SAM domain protein n=1 Tax=Desulfamplus magnetovallimortis TaxID=1246637 RepID=A0A1W1HE20_9BACT|nr:radical SAM protein [Desulfamplus magnetovallimortis]SLM30737.1 Radical SAM domain protein [Desulfamplus magnetovallimortis]